MSTVISTILNISANVSGQQAVEAMRSGIGNIATAFDRAKMAQTSLMNGLRGLAAMATTGVFINMVKGAIDFGGALDDASEKTGVSAVALAKWTSAAKLHGGSLETVEMGFKKLSKTMFDALIGDDKSITAFKALGLSIDDLKKKNPNEVMLKVSEAVSNMPDGLVKAGLMFQIFGKNAGELIPIMNMGREAIDGIKTAMTDEFAKNADIFEQNIVKLKGSFTGLKIEAASGLLPALIDITKSFQSMSGMTGVKSFFESLGEVIRVAQLAFMGLANTLGLVKDAIQWIGELGGAKASGMGWAESLDFANKSFSDKLEKRTDDFRQAYANLSSHSAFLSSINNSVGMILPEPTKEPVAKKQDDSKTQEALRILQEAKDKPKVEAEQNKYDTRLAKLRAESQERKTALMEEISNVNLTAAAIENLKDKRETEKKIQEAVIGLSDLHAGAYRKEATAAEEAREALRLHNEEVKRGMSYGIKDWAQKYQEEVTNTAKKTGDIMQKTFDGMSSGLTNFVMGAKTGFGDLVQSIIADMIKMSIESGITGPLAKALFGGTSAGAGAASGGIGEFIRGIFGFADGGVMTSAGPMQLRRYARGGVANTPQVAIWGEGDKPEANVPLPDGRSIPVTISGGVGGGDTNIEFHYHEATGTTAARGGGMGQSNAAALSGLITNAVKGVILNEKRPGGLLSASAAGG